MNSTSDKSDKKDHLLDVAEKLFSELGYEGASTRHIAKEAAVNMAMLNYYSVSKGLVGTTAYYINPGGKFIPTGFKGV